VVRKTSQDRWFRCANVLSDARLTRMGNGRTDLRNRGNQVDAIDRWVQSMESGEFDFETIAPNACIWHSNDGNELTVEEERQLLNSYLPSIREVRAVELEVHRHDRGAILQYQLCVVAHDGTTTMVPAFATVTVHNDEIIRLDEYLISDETGS
jgi:hypothetical protein